MRTLWLLPPSLLLACGDKDDPKGDTGAGAPMDGDGDGFAGDDDCDDADASVNPDAAEACDGIDNDCDDQVDESGAVGERTFFADADGDGFGDPDQTVDACDPPERTVEDATDCDDTDAAVHPGATEVCDGVDNDCDGDIDDDDEVLGDEASCAATSCLDILDTRASAPADGTYWVDPLGTGGAAEVWCDMTTDGGGYTMLKVDFGSPACASAAEACCASLGMQLFIPRTEAHRDAAFDVGMDAGIGSSGNEFYLGILGIYPRTGGSTCTHTAMQDTTCTSWRASDDHAFWVSARTDISEPNGDNDTNASMYYWWNTDGSLSWYNDIPSPGYSNYYFLCDVGDKY